MDKLAIVINNYIDVECDANTTPRQAYERGFRRAYKKCETVMHSRKTEKEKALMEKDRLKAENAKLREIAKAAWILFLKHGAVSLHELPEVDRVRESLNELGIKVSLEELVIEVD